MAHGELYPLKDPAARKAQIVARMQAQRELWQLNRVAANRLEATDADGTEDGGAEGRDAGAGRFANHPLVRLAVAHPLAAAGIAGVVLMLGPRRLLRMSSWVLPLVLRR